jgi:hypothetical protein
MLFTEKAIIFVEHDLVTRTGGTFQSFDIANTRSPAPSLN